MLELHAGLAAEPLGESIGSGVRLVDLDETAEAAIVLVRREAERVAGRVRVVYVTGRVGGRRQPEGVGGDVAGGMGVVVAVVVVVEARLRVEVLAGEAQGCVGGRGRVPCGDAPQRAATVPGDAALLVDEFGGCADQVGGDGEEACVDLFLRARVDEPLGLSDRRV
ncbi:hypothetical protein GCM10010360_12770 [Streptomyces nogalater]